MEVVKIMEAEKGAKSIKISENDEVDKINEELIKGLANNSRFNNSRSRTQAGKKKGKEYKVLP
ncbi:hypothetical protein Tco_0557459, partial [Tanacetum coccineum]